MTLETIDAAMAAARSYLTAKAADPVVLGSFETALAPLRKSAQTIRDEVRAHAEYLNNTGKLAPDKVPSFRAELEKYAMGHRERMLTVLNSTYTDPKAEGEHAKRLQDLRDVIALERARGN